MLVRHLPTSQKLLIATCFGRVDESELHPGEWSELVRLACDDSDFRAAVLELEPSDLDVLLTVLQSVCRSVNARIMCEYALA